MTDLVEQLKQPLDCEDTLQQWDQWRRWINEGRGSLPRDAFEAFLSCADEERSEAATRITELEAEVARLREALGAVACWSKPMQKCARCRDWKEDNQALRASQEQSNKARANKETDHG
jgi:transposase-like protein